jgi:molecular chaperone DnaJ
MAPDFCYYEILGIDKTADEEAIKKAYRQKARQYHPDRNPGDDAAVEAFKKATEAYDCLSDPVKKSQYDLLASPQPDTTFVYSSTNYTKTNDLFEGFFNTRPRQSGWGQNIETEILIEFLDSAKGCTRTVDIDRRVSCQGCKGTGAKDGKEYKNCVLCDGRGKTVNHHSTGNSFFKYESTCASCKGSGKVISIFCPECNARGFSLQPLSLDVQIPAGINDGMKLCIRGEGDVGLNGTGNLYCVIRVRPHPLFQREGINLFLKLPVGYAQAALGGEIDVPSLDGVCKFKIPPCTRSGATFRLSGLGFKMPDEDETGRGDLLIKVLVDAPKVDEISEEYREVLDRLAQLERKFPGRLCEEYNKNRDYLESTQ